ncbi:metal-dependent hydrolase family protein [Kordiimonas aestuarii]|uniref:metal-dependent hydrolase family protein n=1 Tax=Kordiimonas aestuarii TaxID=1005925 RepID=UPI0021D0997A|nr:amidohydrolase family protein [Kordiimonas aestuarii]
MKLRKTLTTVSFIAVFSTAALAKVTYIHAGQLMADPASGQVKNGQTIFVEDGRVLEIRDGYVGEGDVVDLSGQFVLPGLIDAHVHLLHENGPGDKLARVTKTPADWAIEGVPFARATLMAGFTTVANVGDENTSIYALRDGIKAGKIVGPRVIAAGNVISPHGGEGDVFGYRADVTHAIARPNLCSGADDCRRVVRQHIQFGADMVKIVATGAVLSDADAGIDQQFTGDELKAIVETAHALGRIVTAHAHGTAGINAFLEAGGDSIEHGTYLDDSSITLFRENGAYLVPTLLAGATVTEWANKPDTWLSPVTAKKALDVGPKMVGATRRAHESGVKIAFGTDSSVSPHGQNAREFALLVEAGLTPLEAIQAATVNAAEHLRISDEAGRITPGMSADIVAVKENPLKDITSLERVVFVMKAGTVYREP